MTNPEVIEKIAAIIDPIPGWCELSRVRAIAKLVLDHKITNALLIGVYGGRDTFAVALAMQHRGEGVIHGVDPWSAEASADGMHGDNKTWWGGLDHDLIFNSFMLKRAELSLVPYVKFHRMTNREALDKVKDERFGLIVIDGNHGAESIWDVKNFFPLLNDGGFIYMDDVAWTNGPNLPGVPDAVKVLEGMGVERVLEVGTGRLYRKLSAVENTSLPSSWKGFIDKMKTINEANPVKNGGWTPKFPEVYNQWHGEVTASKDTLGGAWSPAVMSSYTPNLIRWLCSWFPIKNVVDVGCGCGEALRGFRLMGCQVMGIEGLKSAAQLTDVPTVYWNMEYGPMLLCGVDLAFSIEFVEHVANVDAVVETLTCAKMIVMSHATPGQAGHNHVNCQDAAYWIAKFKTKGYRYLEELSKLTRTLDSSYYSATGMIFLRDDVDWGTKMTNYREA